MTAWREEEEGVASKADPESQEAFDRMSADDYAAAEAEELLHEGRELPPPTDPMAVARGFVTECFENAEGVLVLRYWRGGWWRWRTTHWLEWELKAVQQAIYQYTEHASYSVKLKDGPGERPWAPNRHRVADLLEALAAVCLLPETVSQPSWIGDEALDGSIVACTNGLLDVGIRTL